MRNEEMETLVRAEPWVILGYGRKSTGKAGGLVFMVLVVWPARLNYSVD